jgi:hypothetical protein
MYVSVRENRNLASAMQRSMIILELNRTRRDSSRTASLVSTRSSSRYAGREPKSCPARYDPRIPLLLPLLATISCSCSSNGTRSEGFLIEEETPHDRSGLLKTTVMNQWRATRKRTKRDDEKGAGEAECMSIEPSRAPGRQNGENKRCGVTRGWTGQHVCFFRPFDIQEWVRSNNSSVPII